MIENNKTAGLVLPLEDVRYEAHSEKYMLMVAFVDRVFPSFVTKYVQGGYVYFLQFCYQYALFVVLGNLIVCGTVSKSVRFKYPKDKISFKVLTHIVCVRHQESVEVGKKCCKADKKKVSRIITF